MAANQIMTSGGGCTLEISDGDLVLFGPNDVGIWWAGVRGAASVVNFDGIILVQDAAGKILWLLRGPPGSTFTIQNCEISLVDSNGNPVWSSSKGFITTTTTTSKMINLM